MNSGYAEYELAVIGEGGNYWIWAMVPEITCILEKFNYVEVEQVLDDIEIIQENKTLSGDRIKRVGEGLFKALFPGKLTVKSRKLFNGTPVRIKLTVLPPELSCLPWELVRDPESSYLALRHGLSIVRTIPDLPLHSYEPGLPKTLRVLYMYANPSGTPPLVNNDSPEPSQFGPDYSALREVIVPQGGEVVPLCHASEMMLDEVMNGLDGSFDVLHYDGHGTFVDDEFFLLRPGVGEHEFYDGMGGVIALHGGQNERCFASGTELASALVHRGLRLVVLSACETSMESKSERFSGFAHALMKEARLPAVVAMQSSILTSYTPLFTRAFYEALIDGSPVDEAVAKGRRVINFRIKARATGPNAQDIHPSWVTPTLFMVAEDGYILGPKRNIEVDLQDKDIELAGGIEEPKSPEEGGPRYFKSEEIECSIWVSDHAQESDVYFWLVTVDKWKNKFPKRHIHPNDKVTIKEEGRAQEFDLALYAVTPDEHKAILQWLIEGEEEKDFPAFPLPDEGSASKWLDTVKGLRRALPVSLDGVEGYIELPKQDHEFSGLDPDPVRCSGWVKGLKNGVNLWLVVEKGNQRFPKYPNVTDFSPKEKEPGHVEWTCSIHHQPTPQEDSAEEQFDLALYAVNSELHFDIEDALKAGDFNAWPSEKIPILSSKSRRLDRVQGLWVSFKEEM